MPDDGNEPDPDGFVSPAYRAGHGEPLVLLHGLGMSWRAWRPLLDGLSQYHDVFAPTLAGHRGGPELRRPMTVEWLADSVQQQMADAGLDTAHLVGNSLGGWIALELARRNVARSVTAVSPAGAWRNPVDLIRLQLTLGGGGWLAATATSRNLLRLQLWNPSLRRLAFLRLMERGDRMSRQAAMDVLLDARDCTALAEALRAGRRDGQIQALTAAPCPIQVVWGRRDRVIPFARYGRPLLRRVSDVEQVGLAGAGHVPMYDAPTLLRALILEMTARANRPAAAI